jgi:hypothetical protein
MCSSSSSSGGGGGSSSSSRSTAALVTIIIQHIYKLVHWEWPQQQTIYNPEMMYCNGSSKYKQLL